MTQKKQADFLPSLEQLLEAGAHFGHQARRWHPKMSPYIWQARDGIHIFDLIKTRECLGKACEAARTMAAEGKTIVFVGTKRQAQETIEQEAQRCGMPFVSNRWAGGLISNWSQIKKSIDRLIEIREGLKKGEFKELTKKERVLLDKRATQLSRLFGGVVELKDIPDALLIVDIKREDTAVREAKGKGVKIFGIIDSNTDPDFVDYPVPGNDDALRSVKLLVGALSAAIKDGKTEWEKKSKK